MLDLKYMWVLISINRYIVDTLENEKTRSTLKLRCTSKLRIQRQEFFELSEQSVLSNLYWGIDSIEAAIQAQQPEEKSFRLMNSEQMLQVPAMLDEEEVTATVSNRYLVCCSYFYLSVVRNLQGDEWQAALHFLQAVLVSPKLVRTEFASQICDSLFHNGSRSLEHVSAITSEDDIDESVREMARRYKECLLYYKVMLYGEIPWWRSYCSKQSANTMDASNTSCVSTTSVQNEPRSQPSNMVHPLDPEDMMHKMEQESKRFMDAAKYKDHMESLSKEHQIISSIKSFRNTLKEAQSKTPTSIDSFRDEMDSENMDDREFHERTRITKADDLVHETYDWNLNQCIDLPQTPQYTMQEQINDRKMVNFGSSRFIRSIEDVTLSISNYIAKTRNPNLNYHAEELIEEAPKSIKFHLFDPYACKHRPSQKNYEECSYMKLPRSSSIIGNFDEVSSHSGRYSVHEFSELIERESSELIERESSELHYSKALGKCGEEYTVDTASIYECLTSSSGNTYASLKDVLLDELLIVISTSKEEREIRASVSTLTTIISRNKSVIEDIKKKGLRLCDLASALKQNVHEAAILIYLINPSPIDIKTLELLPVLVEIVCTSRSRESKQESLLMTPHAASLMIIEELVTSFDYATNNMHLAAISSPQVLNGLLEVARNDNLEHFFSLTTILIKCMQFDAQCRKYVSQFTPLAPFIHLLQTENTRAKCMALEFFHEILCIPRSSAISLLQRIQQEGSKNIMQILMFCAHQLQPDHQLLAANILLQLDTLNSPHKSLFREEAVQILLRALASEESSEQILSASILSNLAGTYSWSGEPYTAAWLLRKTGLTSPYHQNIIRNFNWLDQSLQDSGTDLWCSKIAKCILSVGDHVYHTLEMGLRSKTKKVSRDCLVTISWLGCQISKSPDSLRYSASEIILSGIEQFLHPGMDLEERLLACLCIYNYATGKGKQKLIHFSEGVKQSLRRLSNVTWMADELHRVADFLLPNISRISCVHTQILEAGCNFNIAVCSLIYYKGLLCSGYSDGSIKVWDIRGHSASLVWDIKKHNKSVTCFSLSELSDSLLSGSADKTIRVWKMIKRKLECVEVIVLKEPIYRLHAHDKTIFAITESQGVKLVNESRIVRDIFKGKHAKCIAGAQGKLYIGCTDSSIQEYSSTYNREVEIKLPTRCWRKQSKPIHSVVAYRDWLYCASKKVEGATIKEWKKTGKSKFSIVMDKGDNVVGMEVVEDFIYLISNSSANNIQIWLRGGLKKLGRVSAGSKITSLLAANDIILCGTETGLIKGWIPL
ncbi:PREDICTED: putative E3 ubiquitin-protein ligase LIN-1 isoform X2 [Lupinus angustifolius]|uniref:putative E3 ubiquitin-protein ligase LIN-1 isoform X2 n=1 Tax=Lupinus angustifolius TaxID=3871 RepID=UPI00092E69C0|nr:PREDICTED: putative E3 ubiquitin-protein ligase LIN-1 isoform X2 [Lupinus angustifolius]